MSFGATAGAAITQLIARGAADFHLTADATVTYWRLKHASHTNFAVEMISQAFNSTPQFGSSVSCTLNRTGDLVHRQYIQLTLPGLFPVREAPSYSGPWKSALSTMTHTVDHETAYTTANTAYESIRNAALVVNIEAGNTGAVDHATRIANVTSLYNYFQELTDVISTAIGDATVATAQARLDLIEIFATGTKTNVVAHVLAVEQATEGVRLALAALGLAKLLRDAAVLTHNAANISAADAAIVAAETQLARVTGRLVLLRTQTATMRTKLADNLASVKTNLGLIRNNADAVINDGGDGVLANWIGILFKTQQARDLMAEALASQSLALTAIDQVYTSWIDTVAVAGIPNETSIPFVPTSERNAGMSSSISGWYCHWCQGSGYAALKQVSISVGNHVIDQFTREFMFMYAELSGKGTNKHGDMVGWFETREQMIAYSGKEQRLTVPIPFWYTQVAGNALSLVSLAYHNVQISVEFETLANMIVTSNPNINVYKALASGASSGTAIAASDLSANLLSEYVYLDVAERSKFSEGLFDQIVSTVQMTTMITTTARANMTLHFNHPMIELIFAARLAGNKTANKYFDFSRSGPGGGSGYDPEIAVPSMVPNSKEHSFHLSSHRGSSMRDGATGRYKIADVINPDGDALTFVSLRVNNVHRFSADWPAVDFRRMYASQGHQTPQGYIYSYSFALFPEEPNPSGSLNFSRLDSVLLDLQLHSSLSGKSVEVLVFGRNWNVFSYINGVGGTNFQ